MHAHDAYYITSFSFFVLINAALDVVLGTVSRDFKVFLVDSLNLSDQLMRGTCGSESLSWIRSTEEHYNIPQTKFNARHNQNSCKNVTLSGALELDL